MADQWDFRTGEIYENFGLSIDSNDTEIKKTYKKFALLYHPDKSKSADSVQKFLLLSNAIGILSDPHQRIIYNERLAKWNDHKKREAEMDLSRKKMKHELLQKEKEAAISSSKQNDFKFHQDENSPYKDKHVFNMPSEDGEKYHSECSEIEIKLSSGERDDLLDLLLSCGEISKFQQISKDHFKFKFLRQTSLDAFLNNAKHEHSHGKFVIVNDFLSLLTLAERETIECPSLSEFILFETAVLMKLQSL